MMKSAKLVWLNIESKHLESSVSDGDKTSVTDVFHTNVHHQADGVREATSAHYYMSERIRD